MRIVFLGDTHGRDYWKSICKKEKWDILVFIGDYFDTHESITPLEQLHNFDEICAFKRASEKPVILLIGNHDEHYILGYSGTSGYQSGAAKNIELTFEQNADIVQAAWNYKNILCTHAGVGEAWVKQVCERNQDIEKPKEYSAAELARFVNDVWKYIPLEFKFNGREPSGDNIGQTPVWIRPRSLMKDAKIFKEAGVIQIVGHTRVEKIDVEGKATGGKYYFIDALGTGEYLIWEDGNFSVNNVNQ